MPFYDTYKLKNGDLLFMSMWGKKIKYIRFDDDLNLQKDVDFNFSKTSFSPLGYLETSEKNFFIDSRYNKKMRKWEVNISEDNDGTIINQRNVISHNYNTRSVTFSIGIDKYSKVDKDKLSNLEISNSKDFICYVNSYKSADKKNELLKISSFDAGFNFLWEKDLKTDEKDTKLLLLDYIITNNGEVCLVFQKGATAKNREFVMYIVTKQGIEKKIISFSERMINCQIENIPNGDILLVGYFRESENKKKFGKYINLYNIESGKFKEFRYPTNVENINNFLVQLRTGLNRDNRRDIFTKYIVAYEDGSVQIIDEQVDISSRSGVVLSNLYIYSLDDKYALRSSEVIDRKISNPKSFNISPIVGFNNGKTKLIYVDRKGKPRYMYAILNSEGIVKDPEILIDYNKLKFIPSNKDSFVFGDGLYMFSRKGGLILQKFQYNFIELND
jgi:hypothetical protein